MSAEPDPRNSTERGAKVRRRRKRQPSGRVNVTREDWIQAALDELGRSGPDQLGIEQLAQRLDRTKGSFYNHFDDRDDLMLAMGEAVRDSDEFQRSNYQSADPAEAANLLGRLFDYAYTAANEQHAFFYLTNISQPAGLVDIIADIRRKRIELYEQLLTTAGLDTEEAHRRAVLMHSAFVGYHNLIETNPDYRAVPEYILTLKELLIPS